MAKNSKMSTNMSEPIAIVGSACRFPGGAKSPSAFWELLKTPRDVASEIPAERFDLRGFYHPDGSHHGTTNVRQAYLLQQDIRHFDSTFFNISPNEADSIDPQHRILLEAVYEALESGGHRIENLRGSDTAVYTGTMSVDWLDSWTRDPDAGPRYLATGVNRAILSNRVSYFFDWHGPSMTIDTACSSSLVAMHQGVHTLRLGESRVALACGTQVILNPEPFIMESKLSMLSPNGRSRMWDADADGYARGEGVGVVVMKRLSDAIADGDHIESIIRETGSNQDGYSNGITVPSTDAQASLIRQTYARAGLDPDRNPGDRPQFFEAHGTGTKAGDPREAAAIQKMFGQIQDPSRPPLYVGSVKTIIGHLEGAAGLAGILKASQMVQHGVVVPNLLFNRLNPDVEPFYEGLHVPTKSIAWPDLPDGVPRRVSVNSFGFGGSNAHAIVEQYQGTGHEPAVNSQELKLMTPFVFSAASETSLLAQLQAYSTYLEENEDVNLHDLAWTLQSRRSELSTKISFSATSAAQLKSKIDAKLADANKSPGTGIGVRAAKPNSARPNILGVFTGQGAQWPAMGAHLIRSSEFVRHRIRGLEQDLSTLPESERPTWSLEQEMLAEGDASRIAEAVMSQPLCTAVQIVLVDLLRQAGIYLTAVVGHSSGEIGAAYAAGMISARDAIRIAYYRGQVVQQAQSGAMLAVGTSIDDARDLVRLRTFRGRLGVAAHNSSASVTLSGDPDAVVHAKKVFDEEKKFARLLKVEKAYHSHHMLACDDKYMSVLRACRIGEKIEQPPPVPCAWFSSVYPDSKPMAVTEALHDSYWRDNMVSSVLFADALTNAVTSCEDFNMVLELGPHPALKGPASQTISEAISKSLPYCGTLSRGESDLDALSDCLGYLWTHLGSEHVGFQRYNTAVLDQTITPQLITNLPSYQWNHGRSHWSEPRRSRRTRNRKQVPHEVLGTLSPDSNMHDMRWSNVLKASEISWLSGHRLQGQIVFPAAGYVAMAFEACRAIGSPDKSIELLELSDLLLPKAITFDESDTLGVETMVSLTQIQHSGSTVTAEFSCYALAVATTGSERDMDLIATAKVKVDYGTPDAHTLSVVPWEEHGTFPTDTDRFYANLQDLGYGYFGPFRALRDIKRRNNHALGIIDSYGYTEDDFSTYLVHPTTLDTSFQLALAACSAPGDGQLWSLHVPTSIKSLRINPAVCASMPLASTSVPTHAVVDPAPQSFTASIDLLSEDQTNVMVRIEDLVIKPFAPATDLDDRVVYTFSEYGLAVPDGSIVAEGVKPSAAEVATFSAAERIAFFYHRKWRSEITDEEWKSGPPHQVLVQNWINHTVSRVESGQHPALLTAWLNDTDEDIARLAEKHWQHVVIRILTAVGKNMAAAVRGETTILEHMTADNMLTEYYEKGAGISTYHAFLGKIVKQIAHRYPRANFIELGAGTGGATGPVLEAAGSTMSSYTYTDISPAFFEQAAKTFDKNADKMTYRVLDIEKSPTAQGYVANSYDVVIAFNVLHATHSLEKTLQNTRQLLKPGGYLILMQFTNNDAIRVGTTMAGLSGWWLGADDGRIFSPTVTAHEWHSVLRKSGFSGVDTMTPEIDAISWPLSIMVSQAVDDRVQYLRRPLSSPMPLSFQVESLVILGTKSISTSRIADELSELLGRYCERITVLEGLPTEEEALTLDPMSTFINLADLDSPIFKDMHEDKMQRLQRVFQYAKHVLWITQGAIADEPYHMASIVFSRAVRREETHISLNHLDVSDIGRDDAAKSIAEHFLQVYAIDCWEEDTALLWSKEPEAFVLDGKLRLPRLLPDIRQNDRLNASRRFVQNELSAAEPNAIAEVVHTDESSAQKVVQRTSFHLEAENDGLPIESSSLNALRILPDTYLFVGASIDACTGEQALSLSTTNAHKISPLASHPIPSQSPPMSTHDLIVAVVGELFAESVDHQIGDSARILVRCSTDDAALVAILRRRLASRHAHLILTNKAELIPDHDDKDVSSVSIDVRGSRHQIRRVLSVVRPTHFLDLALFSNEPDSHLQIVDALPAECKVIDPASISSGTASRPEVIHRDALATQFGQIIAQAVSDISSSSVNYPMKTSQQLVMTLEQVQDSSASRRATSVIAWPSDVPIKAEVHPLDARSLFARDKSYLLTGLSGEIGRSLCEYMVANGAGCVCLTSRRPQVDERWLESLKATGADVRVYPMDVTKLSDVEAVVQDIRSHCPPIAGVGHGANVLCDVLFSRTTIDEMNKTLRPKIDGASNLDTVFHDDDLDFFVLFSSVSSLAGNIGQSAYVAANGFLNGLVRHRRRRGLAASAFDIGRVVGLGVIETVGQNVVDQLLALGLPPLGEQDLQHAFAETILMGRPNPDNDESIPHAVVTTTLRRFREEESEELKGPWFDSPMFSHLITGNGNDAQGRNAESNAQGSKTSLRVCEQLSSATSMEEAGTMLQDCLLAKLQVILQIKDETIDPTVPIVELGIDSLVAVEVRSWFLKELKVDVPVLKVIGGSSAAELCESAFEKIPKDFFKSLGEEGKAGLTEKPVKTEAAEPAAKSSGGSMMVNSAMSASMTSSSSSDRGSTTGASSDKEKDSGASASTTATINSPARSQSPADRAPAKPDQFVKTVPISFAQSRYWFLQQMLEDPRTSNVAAYYHVQGNLRIADLERATRAVLARHEAVRTCFIEDEEDAAHAYQAVLQRSCTKLEVEKATSVEDVVARFAKLREHNFDLASGNLLQMVVMTVSPTSHYLLVHHHHIVMDGVSVQVFLADLEKAYNGHSLGPAPRQYPEFAATQREDFANGFMDGELQSWKTIFPLHTPPPVLPLLPMAHASSRRAMKQFDTLEVRRTLDSDMASRIRQIARKQACTPFHFYTAAFQTILFRFTDAAEIVIGMADAARNTADVQTSVGFFLNLLALKFTRNLDQPFSEAVVNTRKVAYSALESSRLPFDVLLAELGIPRSAHHSPLFQAFVDYRQGSQEGRQPWANCSLVLQESTLGKTAYDITLDVTDTATHALVALRVQRSLYDVTGADLLLETYVNLLEAFVADSTLPLGKPNLFSENATSKAMTIGRGPSLAFDWPETLPHRIDQMIQEFPTRVAVMDDYRTPLTYEDLGRRVGAIAKTLQDLPIQAGDRIVVFQQPAADWVCSMLAIMRVGAVYVPTDLRNPVQRLASLAVDCTPAAILTDQSMIDAAPQLAVAGTHLINVTTISDVAQGTDTSTNQAHPTAPAAILYSSGSTGTPKGIVVTHSGLRNEIEGYTKTWKLGVERVLQQSAFTFDFATDELFTGLANGGMLYIVPADARADPQEIAKIIEQHEITYTRATPSEYSLWLQYGGKNLRRASQWRSAFAGGEALSPAVIREFAALDLPQLRLFNSYGPAETTISSCKAEVDYRSLAKSTDIARIPCGYSLPNYHTYVLDDNLQLQGVGMPGEIYIGGAGVASGYLNNDELNKEHFIANPFATAEDIAKGWARMYRTNDIGHLNNDGALVFRGRVDGTSQVKIRGLRVDLGDVESNILAASGGALREAVVTLHDGDNPFLVAHVVFGSESQVADKDKFLKALLGQLQLPQYMIPVAAYAMDELPLTNHSKIDRKAIASLPLQTRTTAAYHDDAVLDGTLKPLKEIWLDILGSRVNELGLEIRSSTDFFLVGGNSLLVIQLQARIQQVFQVALPLVKLLGASALGDMGRAIDEAISVTGPIPWEEETAPPKIPSFLKDIAKTRDDNPKHAKTILLTGGTGYLANHLIPILDNDPDIAAIHCVALREHRSDSARTPPTSSKITWHNGDLTKSLLGLDRDKFRSLAGNVDAIFHLGATRAIWDGYHVLRASNVLATKEVVKLAAPRQIPISFISSIGVTDDVSDPRVATATSYPSTDDVNGYVTSKWASERILARSADELGVPSLTYRFVPNQKAQAAPESLLDDLARLAEAMQLIPDPGAWAGELHMTPVGPVVEALCAAARSRKPGAHVEHYPCDLKLTGEELISNIRSRKELETFEKFPLLQWLGRAKKLGLDYFIASHEATVGSGGSGEVLQSKR